ncbi:MAG: four-carbon acid sugar kinase family protein [Hyphomicrobiaceae bacterium]|nr:four-carbon acid sugar kinase family protein [Hyphomicrobiaceae bacterium]
MLIGVIADDFTGASDIANTLAKGVAGEGGLATTQFLGVPKRPAAADCEAGVIALKTRSCTASEAVTQSLAALEWLRAQGCRQFVFKYCSTFDSTPDGNIGPVGEALADALGVKGVVACPAFPTAGRTIYQGHLFVGDRLLDDSGLETHPLNPMTDPDLRRWLSRQCRTPAGLVSWSTVRRGAEAVAASLAEAAARGETLVIVDAITDDDLLVLGEALASARLVTGGSGIALGLPRNFLRAAAARGQSAHFSGLKGRAAVLAGSCSRATLAQVEAHVRDNPAMAIDVGAVMSGRLTAAAIVAFIDQNRDRVPLVYSSAAPDAVAGLQATFGREAVAQRLDALFAEAADALVAHGIERLVVAGGETSGAVVSALVRSLGLDALAIGPEIDPGVPALKAEGTVRLALALKSGNFGGIDFFARAARVLAGDRA